MNSIKISDEEIKGLRAFVEKAKEIPMVECVYVVPFKNANNKDIISVITIRNNNAVYNSQTLGILDKRDISEERKTLRLIMDYMERLYSGGRMSFIEEDADYYTLGVSTAREMLASRELVSGTILFDRRGDLSAKQEVAMDSILMFSNVLAILNMDQLESINAMQK